MQNCGTVWICRDGCTNRQRLSPRFYALPFIRSWFFVVSQVWILQISAWGDVAYMYILVHLIKYRFALSPPLLYKKQKSFFLFLIAFLALLGINMDIYVWEWEIGDTFCNVGDNFFSPFIDEPTHQAGNTLGLLLCNCSEVIDGVSIRRPEECDFPTHHFIVDFTIRMSFPKSKSVTRDKFTTSKKLISINSITH